MAADAVSDGFLRKYNLRRRVQPVASDGDCLWQAIAACIAPHNLLDWSLLRALVVVTMRCDPEFVIPERGRLVDVVADCKGDLDRYLKHLDTYTLLSAEMEFEAVQVASVLLQTPITVLEISQNESYRCGFRDADLRNPWQFGQPNLGHILLIHVRHDALEHYDAAPLLDAGNLPRVPWYEQKNSLDHLLSVVATYIGDPDIAAHEFTKMCPALYTEEVEKAKFEKYTELPLKALLDLNFRKDDCCDYLNGKFLHIYLRQLMGQFTKSPLPPQRDQVPCAAPRTRPVFFAQLLAPKDCPPPEGQWMRKYPIWVRDNADCVICLPLLAIVQEECHIVWCVMTSTKIIRYGNKGSPLLPDRSYQEVAACSKYVHD